MATLDSLIAQAQQKAKDAAKKGKSTSDKDAFGVLFAESAAVVLVTQHGLNTPVSGGAELLEWADVLKGLVPDTASAVITSWMGGAPPAEGQALADKRWSAEKVAAKKLGVNQGKVPSVAKALDQLSETSWLVRQICAIKGIEAEKKATKSQEENVEQAVDELKDDVADAVKPVLAGGAVLAIVGLVALLALRFA